MEAALGFSAGGVNVVGLEISDERTVARLVGRSKAGRRLHFSLTSDETSCQLTSYCDQSDAAWPSLFHRIAHFGACGPKVELEIDTQNAHDQRGVQMIWSDLDVAAAPEEKLGLRELLGLALISLEPSLAESEFVSAQTMLECLQLRAAAVSFLNSQDNDGSMLLLGSEDSHGTALTALRTTVAEYYTSPAWEHVRLQLDGSTVAGVARDSLTFKIFRTPLSVGLEFRPVLETGEHPFRSFPGSETDQFGQVYRITHDLEGGELIFPDAASVHPEDRQLIDAIVEGLYPTMRAANIGVGHLDEKVYASWAASGMTFTAAYRLASKTAALEK